MQTQPSQKMKTPQIEHFYTLVNVFDIRINDPQVFTNDVNDPFPKVPRKWYFLDNGEGERVPHVLDKDNTLKRKVVDELFRDVSDYCKHCDIGSVFYHWNAKTIREATQFIVQKSTQILNYDDIQILCWKSDTDMAFHRMKFDRIDVVEPWEHVKANCPVFSEFLSRFVNQQQARSFLAFVGSILGDKKNKTQRGLILFGEGRNGKSTFLRMLDDSIGDACRYKECSKEGKTHAFQSDGIERARVLIYADVEDKNLFSDPMTKGIIGSDKMEINRKKICQFVVKPRAKVIACTNKMPNIRDSIAETRRWVFCEIDQYVGVADPDYQEKFNAESRDVLSACAAAYESTNYMTGSDIKVDNEAMAEVTAMADAAVEYFVKKFFILGDDHRFASSELAPLLAGSKARLSAERVTRYMRKNMKLSTSMTIKIAGVPVRGYKGAKLNEAARIVACLTSTESATSDDLPW